MTILLKELNFSTKYDFAKYTKQHKVRPDTVVTIDGKKVKAGDVGKEKEKPTQQQKDKYKKGEKVRYQIDFGASPMLAKSKAEKSKEKVGVISKAGKNPITGKPQYTIGGITIPHSNISGIAENKMTESGWEYDSGFYNSKVNKEKETITFINDADVRSAKSKLGSMKVTVSGKTMKFLNTADFKKAKNVLKIGENKMKITKRELVEMIKVVVKEETEYQKFFKEKLGGRNLGDMSDEEKKTFFADVDKEWKAKNENVEETLEPISQAAGEPEANPTQRLKAKKRDQMLAQESKVEQYLRKIIREELKFVMFNEIPGGLSRKVAKKRISQLGSTDKSL